MTQPKNNDGNSAVQLTHVTRTYKRDEFEMRALDEVTLDIPRKSFVAIMGPSRSGKTTPWVPEPRCRESRIASDGSAHFGSW